ncbi:MAG TPA: flavodoxin [Desulfobacterales bacterium]|nr:flavodoxin [Desulfobacterales bacterium]
MENPRKGEQAMKVLNLYFTTTGNTTKVADQIAATIAAGGHQVDTIRITANTSVDLLEYDLIFVGSGVYEWLPGKPLRSLFSRLRQDYVARGEIRPGSPLRQGKTGVVYCTYGGGHTGVNEAIPTAKYMGQLLEHLGIPVIAEWYLVGEYHGKLQRFSTTGRLGDISGRPNKEDLRQLAELVQGILKAQLPEINS